MTIDASVTKRAPWAALFLLGCGGPRAEPPGGSGTVMVPGDAAMEAAADTTPAATDVAAEAAVDRPPPRDAPAVSCEPGALDLLLVIDNSNSMAENQANLARNLGVLLSSLLTPPTTIDPMTGMPRPRYPAVQNLRVGVASTDLGTPGSSVPSCSDGDVGDDGRLNPIRNGFALRAHPPWSTARPGVRPARCTTDREQYPAFLRFASGMSAADFSEDVVCNAYLSLGGCGLEQPLEAAYRALVVHGATSNAGFLRDEASLGIVLLTDEDDGSVRDCRNAEPGAPCADALSVYDSTSRAWASADLNLRFYLYAPGGAQDPTWPIDRYVDPRDPSRGFPSLKPGHPERVFFSAIIGVPINPPMRGDAVDWAALLGSNPDGSDGYVGMSAEGPVSMRQRNQDPACSARVVPSCRREGSTASTSCDAAAQYYAWPARRVAQVARRFAETWGTGAVTSICRNDYSAAFANLLGARGCPSPADASTPDAAVDAAPRDVAPSDVNASQ